MDPFNYVPLHLQTLFNATMLSEATGFIIQRGDKFYLITNWHVVSGRNPETGAPSNQVTSGIPNRLAAWFPSSDHDTAWLRYELPLLSDEDTPLWIEHPDGRRVDVAAIELPHSFEGVTYKPLSLPLIESDLHMHPAEDVSVVGYPFGKRSFGEFPIWKTGHIASDVRLDYEGKPAFLVDGTLRDGMSGSPVIARKFNHPDIVDLNQPTTSSYVDRFLGIFSAGISTGHREIEIGIVWKPKVIVEMLPNS